MQFAHLSTPFCWCYMRACNLLQLGKVKVEHRKQAQKETMAKRKRGLDLPPAYEALKKAKELAGADQVVQPCMQPLLLPTSVTLQQQQSLQRRGRVHRLSSSKSLKLHHLAYLPLASQRVLKMALGLRLPRTRPQLQLRALMSSLRGRPRLARARQCCLGCGAARRH